MKKTKNQFILTSMSIASNLIVIIYIIITFVKSFHDHSLPREQIESALPFVLLILVSIILSFKINIKPIKYTLVFSSLTLFCILTLYGVLIPFIFLDGINIP